MKKQVLTAKQKALVNEYLVNGGNATQAALKAGYSKATATRIASQVLKKDYVIEYLQRQRKKLEKADIAKVEDILSKLTQMMSDPNVQDKDKLKAMDMLLKAHGAYTQKLEVTQNNIKITVDGDDTSA